MRLLKSRELHCIWITLSSAQSVGDYMSLKNVNSNQERRIMLTNKEEGPEAHNYTKIRMRHTLR